MPTTLLRPSEVATRLGVTTKTVERYINDGQLEAQQLPGGHYRVLEPSVLAMQATIRAYRPKTTGPVIIAVVNQKGGVGKTTLTAGLVAAAADQGLRVLAVDFDPTASYTGAVGAAHAPVLYQAIHAYCQGETPDPLVPLVLPGGEHLIPGHIELAAAEQLLQGTEARERALSTALAPLLPAYDLVVVDTGPTLGILLVNALALATAVVIPMQPETMAVDGLANLLPTIARVQKRINPALHIAGVVLTMVQPKTTLHSAIAAQVAESLIRLAPKYRVPLLAPPIPRSIKVAEATARGIAFPRYPGTVEASDACRALLAQLLPAVKEATL